MNSVFVNPGIYSCAVDASLEVPTHSINFIPYTFALVFPALERFRLFTSWPMLSVATFINPFCVARFPRVFRMRRFWLFCYLMADVICCYIY